MSYVGSIPVRDANGDEFTVYEFQERRFLKTIRRFKLCTGETVEKLGDRLIIVATGEVLIPTMGC